MQKAKYLPVIFLLIFLSQCSLITTRPGYDYGKMDRNTRRIYKKIEIFLKEFKNIKQPSKIVAQVGIDSIQVNSESEDISIYFNKYLAQLPFRIKDVDKLYTSVITKLGWWYRNYDVEIFSLEIPVEQLVPNYYREDESAYDPTRLPFDTNVGIPLIRNKSHPASIKNGLYGHPIALWHSHGWYYDNEDQRWEWQRPRLFQTVEDLLPLSITMPYLIPMLENAGANVFVPRERCFQTEQVIVDNDSSQLGSEYREFSENKQNSWKNGKQSGFAIGNTPYKYGENPFKQGKYRYVNSDSIESAWIEWIPEIPETGKYGVYISYNHSDTNATDAHYSVHHLGGTTEFLINQTKGGGTWIYLGKFRFAKGLHPDSGKVVLSNRSQYSDKIITSDAIRFGGGMGNVKRGLRTSQRPRYEEGARYYLQYSGMPDSLVYSPSDNTDDYKDDYQSRGEWVNYLKGAPFGPNKNRASEGLNIPIDLSCGIHTDAGIKRKGKVVGTLGIYSLDDAKGKRVFPDGVSRLASRDAIDIAQSQIVNDIRVKYDSDWSRRALRNGRYSEAYRPNLPAMMIELFSHQNFEDMKYGMDPNFRFDLSRSIYKGILKFISTQYNYEYVVQPLPVTHFSTEFVAQRKVKLSWQPQEDSLESTAYPEKYILYTRIGDKGFNNGKVVEDTVHIIENLEPGVNYSFKITAVNSGGESFPSEILSVCWQPEAKGRVLIVNGFDRICGPAKINKKEFEGFANFIDEGVPYKYNTGYTGRQHNFNPNAKWLTNEYPGWGTSYANYENNIIAGNSFDYPIVHGKAIKAAGYSYVSVSDEAVMEDCIQMSDYKTIDFIFGEEKKTVLPDKSNSSFFKIFPKKLKKKIEDYCNLGGDLFISGAYLGSDMFTTPQDSTDDANFAREILKYELETDHAVKNGEVFTADTNFAHMDFEFEFNTKFSKNIYKVEAPDAIVSANKDSA
ncbi:MAG: fibronectin type III domain-containing protein, partial [Candidatus Marinimicrobia bacterium]|nr:fibronectin type III domain-containing protein [Candidatus Neomarinimicrobiota bacterium]